MKKTFNHVDEKTGMVQITTWDERWYADISLDTETGLPHYNFLPSVTWIAGHYPKGIQFYKWLASKGWDEAEAIKQSAGDRGSKVHQAITNLLSGTSIQMEVEIDGKIVQEGSQFLNKTTGKMEVLTPDEYECVMSFLRWFKEMNPQIIASEIVVRNEKVGYAGTVDLITVFPKDKNGEAWLIDIKTGQNIWAEYELQVSAYKHAQMTSKIEDLKLAILQLGYKRNKNGWKFTPVDDKFPLFLAARQIWANETEGEKPLQKDYPLLLTLKPAVPASSEAVSAKQEAKQNESRRRNASSEK